MLVSKGSIDKTGTVTEGKPKLVSVKATAGYTEDTVLRWAASPFCLLLAFLSNGMLVLLGADQFPTAAPALTAVFIAQCAFYSAAALAAIQPSLRRFKLVKLAYYFVFMNFCAILGFFRFLNGSQSAIWEKARRAQTT